MTKKEFTSKTKKEVRIATNFRCCLCRDRICTEIHHINPEKNDFNNAIPLCDECHSLYASNPSREKMLIQARDDWYAIIKKRKEEPDIKFIGKIFEKLEEIEEKSISKKELLDEIQPLIIDSLSKIETAMITFSKKGDYDNVSNYIDYLSSSSTASNYILKAIENIDADKKDIKINDIFPAGGSVTENKRCPFCSYDLSDFFYIPDGKCPNCHRPIWYS
jgi:hypothetical protein